ncbi:hypothetical protein [uncultured Draconibacterium sp.]|uniref:hypothetical protein n=1 Tax=uncultured Draconibacterium sp. TaxID=1573823 RepID=UPI003217D6FE
MKKQILFLTFFVAAILAGMNSYGQYINVPNEDGDGSVYCLTPQPLSNCTDVDALHPIQGANYTYSVANTPANATIRWFVVNNTDLTDGTIGGGVDSLINKQNEILPVDASYIDATDGSGVYEITVANPSTYLYSVTSGASAYNSLTSTATSIEMAWKYFDGVNNQVLLVAYVESDPTCTDNIAVWRIIPEPAFTIDVAVLNDDGDSIAGPLDPITGECVSPIEFAIYDPSLGTTPAGETPGDQLTVDYGENWVFFVVNGANYFDSWMPEIQLIYDPNDASGDVPVATVSWAYASDATSTDPAVWNTLSGTGALATTATTWTSAVPVIAGANAASVTAGTSAVGNLAVPAAGGECIVVRVQLDWGTDIEHDLATSTLNFAANGIAYDGDDSAATGGNSFFDDRTNFEDLHHANCTADSFTNDEVDYQITPRPQVENGTPTQEVKTGQGIN